MVTASLSVRFLSGDRDTEMFRRSLGTETFFVSYPINWTSKEPPADTLIENLPSASVEVPLVVPGTSTNAPGKGSPFSSTTVPVTVIVPCCAWASAKTGHNKAATTKIRISLIFIMSYFWLKVGINFSKMDTPSRRRLRCSPEPTVMQNSPIAADCPIPAR